MTFALACAWFGFCVLQSALWWLLVVPRSTKKAELSVPTRFEWSVKCTEAFHGTTMLVGGVCALVARRSELEVTAPFEELDALEALASSRSLRWLLEIMLGYLFFDTCFELALPLVRNRDKARPRSCNIEWAFIVHHLFGIGTHAATLLGGHALCAGYAPYVYLAEASTPFLHVSWMLKQCGRAGPLYMANGLAGAATYLIFRIVLPPLILRDAVYQRDWSLHPGGDLAGKTFIASLAFFAALNLFWFTKLIKLIAKAGSSKKQE